MSINDIQSVMQTIFEYKDGTLYWKNPGPNNFKKYAGKKAGSLNRAGYRQVNYQGKKTYVHRIVWQMHNGPIPDGYEIHHINTDRDDNRLENLQMVTHQQNLQLKEAKGYYQRGNKYYAVIKADGSGPRWLGSYDTPEEAREAHLKAKKVLHHV